MASPLESAIRKQVASAFAGKLLKCTLRRPGSTTTDSFGDPIVGTPQTWTFDGFRDTFNAFSAAQAGIPVTDAKILIIAGSLAATPKKDDLVKIRDQWLQLRRQTAADPAGATYEFAGFEVPPPA